MEVRTRFPFLAFARTTVNTQLSKPVVVVGIDLTLETFAIRLDPLSTLSFVKLTARFFSILHMRSYVGTTKSLPTRTTTDVGALVSTVPRRVASALPPSCFRRWSCSVSLFCSYGGM